MNMGIIGGVVGSIIGLIGGIIGTYCCIKNTNGPKEKAFMIKISILGWIGIIVFLALMFLLPRERGKGTFVPSVLDGKVEGDHSSRVCAGLAD